MSAYNIYIIMGVSGCGKSTLGKALAKKMNGLFFEGDDYHPESNRKKMQSGEALTDRDREGWLYAIAGVIAACTGACKPTFISCSALKASYREILRTPCPTLRFVHLIGKKEMLQERIERRQKEEQHFMPAALIDSQFADLEIPNNALEIPIDLPLEDSVAKVEQWISATNSHDG